MNHLVMLAEELRGILASLERRNSDAIWLDLRVRQVCADAGRRLYGALRCGIIAPPDPRTPWLNFALDEMAEARFTRYETDSGLGGGGHPQSKDEVLESLRSCREYLFKRASQPALVQSLKEFVHSHLFLEALATWLPDRFPSQLAPLTLPKCRLWMENKQVIVLVTDQYFDPFHPQDIALIGTVCRSSAIACTLLAAAGAGWMPEGEERSTSLQVLTAEEVSSVRHPAPDESQSAPRDPKPNPRSLRISDDGGVAILGSEHHPITPEQARILRHLLNAKGGFVPSDELKAWKDSHERPDRIIDRLPRPIHDLIEARRGAGYRLRMPVE
ncbi:MAG: helix-turn-helix domain-containing protein [Planctomycetota bacterium]|nr:MAG: helix-turn-helix domain-containing protein [Planctomycetota bacterium]